ncbi:MAG: Gfo/Idh/MocA family oxidoreductase [Planctomycetales bacterium]|nr:Gfo/Idh/MocA family oxidoreductase [Planctomycetales bacterium]
MRSREVSRRRFLQGSSAAGVCGVGGFFAPRSRAEQPPRHKVERLGIGGIGLRYQGTVITDKARLYGDVVALCDVDRHVREQARASFGSTPKIFEDYRELLARPEVDVVMIGAPDHWHVKMAVDACRAGKDVYVEKPISLTVDEGKILRRVARETGRVVQVGSWQRSDARYRQAVEMVRAGRLGDLKRVTCVTGPNPRGGPFPVRPVPGHLNWDLWLGPAPQTPYIEERCHYTFRWWYQYAGGKITDWGAHDIDIAQWAINEYPIAIDARGTLPQIADGYNVSTDFQAKVRYPSGVELVVSEEGRTGVLFEGEKGRMFVNRGTLAGTPVDDLKTDPLPRDMFRLYDFDNHERPERVGKLDAIVNHMGNFFDCVASRETPISDFESQHRSATTCHLINLSIRLGRPLRWNAQSEQFVDDSAADAWLRRESRKGFEIA